MRFAKFGLVLLSIVPVPVIAQSVGRVPTREVTTTVPKLWNEEALAAMTLPPARPEGGIVYVSSAYFYAIPPLTVHKTYPVYRPDREPRGYLDWLKKREPVLAFPPAKLRTEADWIRAGEMVFSAPIAFESVDSVRDPSWYAHLKVPVTKQGVVPGHSYVIRKKGHVELGVFSCATCHSRVLPDGTLASGAQGNFPLEAAYAYSLRKKAITPVAPRLEAGLNFSPSERKRLTGGLYDMSVEEIASVHEEMIPGIAMRSGFSYLDPPKIADLIGLADRKYLDMTARLQHRSIGDVMRYGTMDAGLNYFFSATGPVPPERLPDPKTLFRYSDEQAYAYSRYVYALRPPPNTNGPTALTRRGRRVFEQQGCGNCHTPPLYTNNKLTLAGEFVPPEDHKTRYDVHPVRVGTDARSAFTSLRGRGYYKVPSLKGVWYRGPFEHNGSVATLEDWFDPARLRDDYMPTGFKGYGVKTRAVRGHEFGLSLSAADKAALIAFLKTL